jgi:hypothetical protein
MAGDASHVIGLFTDFLEAFGKATPAERRAFIDFISPQSRDDLIHLADALREKAAKEGKPKRRTT